VGRGAALGGPAGRTSRAIGALRPEERLAIVYAAAVGVTLAARGLPFTLGPMLVEYGRFVGAIAALAVPAWLAVRIAHRVRRRAGADAPPSPLADLGELARALAGLLVVLVAYTNLKTRIFALHPSYFDPVLLRLDAALHFGGGDFLGWTLGQRPGPAWTDLWQRVYFFAWAALAVPFAVVFARRGGAGARRIVAALALVYAAGSLVYLALPSLGPAFAFRERFAAAYGGTTTFGLQEMMLRSARHLLAHPETRALPFFGIAAFPSLHLATTGVGLFAAWRWAKPLLVALVPWNLAIAWSALILGWHYALDFYPGLALAGGAWWLAGRWTEPPGSDRASGAGGAGPAADG
jgi:hypothetical protein